MKRLSISLSLVLVFTAVLTLAAPAAAVTIGTLTGGTGTATLSGGQPSAFAFSGHFAFDNVATYGGLTLAQIFGDVGQYSFAANTDGSLHAYDVKPLNPTLDKGSVKWGIYGTNNGTTFYGQAMTLAFSGGTSGSATGVFTSDGFIHWYYGYDEDTGPPAGKTSMALYGMPAASYFFGQYGITSQVGDNISFNINGEFTPVPIPGTVLLLGSGLAGLGFLGRRRLFKRS